MVSSPKRALRHFSLLVNGSQYDVLAPPMMSLAEVLVKVSLPAVPVRPVGRAP